jgi:citrate lyase subunit beta/citryl-CoA lyase
MVAKAGCRGADGVILNLEDAVAPKMKERARKAVADALVFTDFGNTERIVRINPLDSDFGFSDLLAIAPRAPDAILLSKVTSGEEVRTAAWMLERLESLHALPLGRIQVMCMVETAAGVLAAPEIAHAHPRVAALIFGAADFCAEVDCAPAADQRPLLYASSRLILAARSARVAAIDAPHMKFGDPDGLEQSVRLSRDLGFDGKSAIHPVQIPVINSRFSPDPEQVRWAQSVVNALSASNKVGAALLNGDLIEAPHLSRARKILEIARRVGIEGSQTATTRVETGRQPGSPCG